MDKQVQLLVFNIILFTSRFLILVLGGKTGNIILTIKFLGVSGGIVYLGFCFYILRLSEINMKKIYIYFIKKILYSIPYIIYYSTFDFFSFSYQTEYFSFDCNN